jgi:D-alanyl-D-alanine carboxypeptidase
MRRLTIRSAVIAMLALFVFVASVFAGHLANAGWTHRHSHYPAVPNGLAAINTTFGTKCTTSPSISNFNRFTWSAWDDGFAYPVNFHKKLGGEAVPNWYLGNGGGSTNLWWDVVGHVTNEHQEVKSGIWGYICKKIDGTEVWSTHSWGIAVDINSAYEHIGSAHKHNHSIDPDTALILQQHGWTWGIVFGDAMHFQYATGY